MHDHDQPAPELSGAQAILANLEQQLAALDRLGAHLAAARCDAAIQQLRLYLAHAASGDSQPD